MRIVGTKRELVSDKPLLVLSTGGPAGLYQARVIEVVIQEEFVISDGVQIIGGSAGAVNTWLVSRYAAQALRTANMRNVSSPGKNNATADSVLRELIESHPLTNVWLDVIFPFMKVKSKVWATVKMVANRGFLFKTEDLYSRIDKYIDYIDDDIKTGKAKEFDLLPFYGTAAHDMNSGDTVVSTSEEPVFQLVTEGSAAIPLIFKSVNLSQRMLVDVGVNDPLLLLTTLGLVERNSVKPSRTLFLVAQEPGLQRYFFSETWLKRRLTQNASWLKDTVFDALITSHIREIGHNKFHSVEMDNDLILTFSPNNTILMSVKTRAASDAEKVIKILTHEL